MRACVGRGVEGDTVDQILVALSLEGFAALGELATRCFGKELLGSVAECFFGIVGLERESEV